MKFGFHLPQFGDQVQSEDILRAATHAEALGFDSVWVSDHVIIPESARRAFGGTLYDPLITLSVVAGATRTIRLGFSVLILPYRHPLAVAKAVATLDALSHGRVICGVGAGWLADEFNVLGVPFAERGARSDEYLRIFQALWTQDSPQFAGQFFRFSNISSRPQPVQKPHPPLWVGGGSRRSLRRVVEFGDAWHPTRTTPGDIAPALEYLRTLAARQGRPLDHLAVVPRLRLRFGEPDASPGLSGTPAAIRDQIRAYQQASVDYIVLDPSFDFLPLADVLTTMERFAQDVRPHVA